MSSFACEHCGAVILDSPNGYITGCPHYPIERPPECRTDLIPMKEVTIEQLRKLIDQ